MDRVDSKVSPLDIFVVCWAQYGSTYFEIRSKLVLGVFRRSHDCLDAIDRHVKSSNVPQKLLNVLDGMKRGLVRFQSKEHKGDTTIVLDLESPHVLFDKLIQRTSNCVVLFRHGFKSKEMSHAMIRLRPRSSLRSNVEKNDQNRLDAIDRLVNSSEIPQELLNVLKEMKRDAARVLSLPHETETKVKSSLFVSSSQASCCGFNT
ncbi:unnamed protein product [Brassica oleracea var. botrytis]|uniref:(rape) hypothetical protein n=1 Tax=Brassica napus TaxID=3708 RepID=A0A816RU37_BRANA|nr:unnamed protein product [Brassica napus]